MKPSALPAVGGALESEKLIEDDMSKIARSALLLAMVSAPIPTVYAHAQEKVDAERLSNHVKVLASDEFEGRGIATEGEKKTVQYLSEQFKAAGLQPGGDKGDDGQRGWTQAVPLIKSSFDGTVTATLGQGKQPPRPLRQGEEIAVLPAQTDDTTIAIENAPLVFLGYGVSAPERKWDDFKGVDLKGKIGVVLINDPDFEAGKGDFGGKAMTYYGRWTYKYEEAARQGALGLLIVHETAPAAYGWPTVKNSFTDDQFDIIRDNKAEVHVPLKGWIQHDVAVELFKNAGQDFDALKAKAQTRDFSPVALDGATLSVAFKAKHEKIVTHNVVGFVPGKQRQDEAVIYSAHWDHLGVGEPDATGDKIYNGAVDNGTGLASLLEVARLQAKASPPARSVVFLSVTSEETGLLGSMYYAANPLYPLPKTAAVLNFDALTTNGRAKNISPFGNGDVSLEDEVAGYAKAEGRVFTPDPKPEAGLFYRSDHFSFAKAGVPAMSFGLDGARDLVKGGRQAGEAWYKTYVAERYHQPADEWSADWNLSGVAEDVDLVYRMGSDLANSDKWPDWHDGSEFKKVREESAAERQ